KVDVDAGRRLDELVQIVGGARIVVRPPHVTEPTVRAEAPARDDQLGARRLVLGDRRTAIEAMRGREDAPEEQERRDGNDRPLPEAHRLRPRARSESGYAPRAHRPVGRESCAADT